MIFETMTGDFDLIVLAVALFAVALAVGHVWLPFYDAIRR